MEREEFYLERHQKLFDFIEIIGDIEQLVHNVFNTNNTRFAKTIFDQFIRIDGHLLRIDAQETMFEDQLSDRIGAGISPCHIWFDQF